MAETCCGCIELRLGCLIIGYMQLVCEIILGVVVVSGLELVSGAVAADRKKSDALAFGDAAPIISLIILLVIFLMFTFTIVLLVGVHQNKRGHVKAYLIFACIWLVLSYVRFFASFTGKLEALVIGKDLIIILLDTYLLLVIRRYYLTLDGKRSQTYTTTFKADQDDPLMV